MKQFISSSTKKTLLLSISILFGAANADQNIEIKGGNNSANDDNTINVVQFAGDNGDVTNELATDFSITGEFKVSTINTAPSTSKQYVLSGTVTNLNNGMIQIDYQLSKNGVTLINQTNTASIKAKRKAVHVVSNSVYKQMTGDPGIFTSKIATIGQRDGKYSLVISDYDGYNPTTIFTSSDVLSSIAWNNGGNNISYVSYANGKPRVYMQNLSTGHRYIVSNFDGSNSSPAFINNNQMIVTLSKDYGSQLYKINTDKYTPAKTATKLFNKFLFSGITTEADVANGNVLFTSDHNGGPQIFMTDTNGSYPKLITNKEGGYNTTGRFSNSGNKIVFISRSSGLSVYVKDLTTGISYPISKNINLALSPSFAPNDKLVLFSNNNSLYIANTTGTSQSKLGTIAFDKIIDQKWSNNY